MKIAGILSYIGEPYYGFQRLKNHPSVQAKLEEVLSFIAGEPVEVKAAGRTDAGVNALGQVFAFESTRAIDLDRLKHALNRLLPPSISVSKVVEVPSFFDPRHSSCAKEYVYQFYYGDKEAFKKDTWAYFGMPGFDPDVFIEALQIFKGKHDFRNFTSKQEDKDDFIRDITTLKTEIDREAKQGKVTFIANGFMTYQIRFMVGAAYQVAYGKKAKEEVSSLLDSREGKRVSFKAPAQGLTLLRVYYEDASLGL